MNDGLVVLFDMDTSNRHGQIYLATGKGFMESYLSDADLGPSAFLHVSVRTWAVTILALVLAAILRTTPLADVSADAVGGVIAGTVFVGALTPSVLLQLIVRSSLRRLGGALGKRPEETSLTDLPGMNPWKAARFAEEGIDNVENLAMEDPSRLVVVTREGGLRILDWIDQAILWTAASKSQRDALEQNGIRTAFGLYLAFREDDLVDDSTIRRVGRGYRVKPPPDETFPGLGPASVRNVLLAIVHTPNFEHIRQMREQAIRSARTMFKTTVRQEDPQPGRFAPVEPTAVAKPASGWPPVGALVVHRPGQGPPAAMGVAIDPRTALTIMDARADVLAFTDLVSFMASGGKPVDGRGVAADTRWRLALFELERQAAAPVELGPADPGTGDEVRVVSFYSGVRTGTVSRTGQSIPIASADGEVRTEDVTVIATPATPGEGGAPIIDRQNRLLGIAIAGSDEVTLAVPVSAIRRFVEQARSTGGRSRPPDGNDGRLGRPKKAPRSSGTRPG